MDILWQILIQFVFRLTFGIALAMTLTPARLVTSGFYRVHLWVLMGLNTFAALGLFVNRAVFAEQFVSWSATFIVAIVAAVFSYVGAVIWLYERKDIGFFVLVALTAIGFGGAVLATPWGTQEELNLPLTLCNVVSAGLLLGVTMTAMLLGHWYLNTPTMELLPLQRLVWLMAVAVALRIAVCGFGLAMVGTSGNGADTTFWIFVAFRWLSGLLGTGAMAWMTWNVLKVPNTQSATGILYAGVILAFLGELNSQLLSINYPYPL
ncbi:MAG TPA: hypothetical protein DCY79_02510 [Planctomycetaceae bacterium]|nr:hypothetical protein [Blastopirellula sp.]HAY78662.1 hypothetical protein [Planctomycetaceae bacterium]